MIQLDLCLRKGSYPPENRSECWRDEREDTFFCRKGFQRIFKVKSNKIRISISKKPLKGSKKFEVQTPQESWARAIFSRGSEHGCLTYSLTDLLVSIYGLDKTLALYMKVEER